MSHSCSSYSCKVVSMFAYSARYLDKCDRGARKTTVTISSWAQRGVYIVGNRIFTVLYIDNIETITDSRGRQKTTPLSVIYLLTLGSPLLTITHPKILVKQLLPVKQLNSPFRIKTDSIQVRIGV